MNRFLTIALLFFSVDGFASIATTIDGEAMHGKMHEIVKGQSIRLQVDEATSWYRINPIQQEYSGIDALPTISYTAIDLQHHAATIHLDTLGIGTWFFSTVPFDGSSTNIFGAVSEIIQIAVRPNDTYLGYLREMTGVPFTIPPRRLMTGHQTDLRLGTDCAELAIYGMRRLGHHIPYCGPKGISAYCTVSDRAENGDLVHFGDQVSVIFEDRGTPGVFDQEDLLIHARPEGVVIETWGDSEFSDRRSYQVLRWAIPNDH